MSNDSKKDARALVPAARAFAISSYTQLLDKYPILEKVDPEHWDFVLTVGGVFVAVSQLNHENISEEEKNKILDIVTKSVGETYPDGVDACEDCRKFVDRTYDGLASEAEYKENPKYLFSDSLGGWVVWNLFGHAPEGMKERELLRVMGTMLVASFASWWK